VYTIIRAINFLAGVLYVLILVRVVFSWVQPRRMSRILHRVEHIAFVTTEPLLRPVRNLLFRYQRGSPVDFSPLVLYLLIELARGILIRVLAAL
jgi:YggT family protein